MPLLSAVFAREVLVAGGLKGAELTRQVEARVGRRNLLTDEDPPQFRTIVSETVLRTPLCQSQAWGEQLQHLSEAAERPNVTLQVLPHGARLHALASTDVMFLRLLDGGTVAYTESALHGELVEECGSVESLQRAYDAVRDLALSPAETRKWQMLEDVPCEPST
ncbi:hypothetical protein Sgleb_40040 [Streptomyces glebosus]|uniref:DUF5753 domain-containing protein n=1 Tax=Streptomyces glebosus TaxID=249580 RepID=A0A640SX16_9ACTN|nr:hypothetical protein Sgleb_40040 [Streptomyces glebosus]GHG85685.1 hypothetical protein GCM10010513_66510 [Streptomyces glebosus]